jgi:hypothetical protein
MPTDAEIDTDTLESRDERLRPPSPPLESKTLAGRECRPGPAEYTSARAWLQGEARNREQHLGR